MKQVLVVLFIALCCGSSHLSAQTGGHQTVDEGKDSVIFRTPDGELIFAGMGKMRLEDIVAREAAAVIKDSAKYEGDLAIPISNTTEMAETMARLAAQYDDIAMIFGNAFLILAEQGTLTSLKIGDVLEIAKRTAASNELAPFRSFWQ